MYYGLAVGMNNTTIEPTSQPISGEALSHASAISEDGAHLDITADGFHWGGGLVLLLM